MKLLVVVVVAPAAAAAAAAAVLALVLAPRGGQINSTLSGTCMCTRVRKISCFTWKKKEKTLRIFLFSLSPCVFFTALS